MRFFGKVKNMIVPHYLIIGNYSKSAIGCTCGKSGKKDVLAEEPMATFQRICRRKCPICKEFAR